MRSQKQSWFPEAAKHLAESPMEGFHEAARVHYTNRRRGGWVDATGGRPAAANYSTEESTPTGYVNARRLRAFGSDSGAILPRAARARLCRRAEYSHRAPIWGLACRKVTEPCGRAG